MTAVALVLAWLGWAGLAVWRAVGRALRTPDALLCPDCGDVLAQDGLWVGCRCDRVET